MIKVEYLFERRWRGSFMSTGSWQGPGPQEAYLLAGL